LNLLAEENGYFKENGLDAEIHTYDTAPVAVTALLAGEVDVAIASDFTGVRNIFTNDNLRILTQVSSQEVLQLIGRKDKGISTEADLKGKRIGITRKSVGEFFLGQFLTFNDLNLQDVVIVDLPTADLVSHLESGDIDAAVLYDPFAYNLKKELGDKLVAWSAQKNQKVFSVDYTTAGFISAHGEVLERYLRSLVEAEKYVTDNQAAAKSFIAKRFNYDDAYIEYIWPKINIAVGLDQALILTMEGEARWSIANKLTDKISVPNYTNYVYFGPLEKLKPEAITIVR